MTIPNLYAMAYYPTDNGADLPVVALMHGWSDAANSMSVVDLRRIANLGFVVLDIGMRGRNGASGSKDGCGR